MDSQPKLWITSRSGDGRSQYGLCVSSLAICRSMPGYSSGALTSSRRPTLSSRMRSSVSSSVGTGSPANVAPNQEPASSWSTSAIVKSAMS